MSARTILLKEIFYPIMRLLTMNLCLTLLWGTSLFPMEAVSTNAPTPQTDSRNSTAESNDATAQLNTSRVPHDESQEQTATRGPTPQTAATAGAAASNATERREASASSAADAAASSWSHVFTSATEATPSHRETTAGAAGPEPAASARLTAAAATTLGSSAAASASAAGSTLEATPTTGPGVPQNLASTTSSDYLTHPPPSMQSFTSPSASTGSTNTTNHTVEAPPALDPTSPPVRKSAATTRTGLPSTPQSFIAPSASTGSTNTTNHTVEAPPALDPTSPPVRKSAATTRTGLPSTPQPVSDAQNPTSASKPSDTTGPSSSPGSPSPSDSTAFSSSSAGIFIRPVSKFVPVFTTKPAATTTAAPRASQSPSTTVVQPCSSRGLVTQCLIIIASLAGLAAIFMVSTIVLCAKVSERKYKARKPKDETEMMCISALLPERSHTYTRQHNPVSNGVLVLPMGADSDDDMGDNLTLSSFLPDNERTV